ncbi:MAG: DUF2207 domain-containing protein [Bacilli bacterium]|nr:DUF2207 domain-containing protein [Bacilli bacterium]
MKKILIFITCLFVIPFSAKALEPNYTVEELAINATVQANGNMLVKEAITLAGDFNGYIRDLYYKGDYPLYDASALQLMKVCESNNNFEISNCFTKDDYASLGDSYKYIYTENTNYSTVKMFNYTQLGNKTFYIEYLLEDVVLVHNDVAELYWTFIGENFADDIGDVKITINLPSESEELRAWAHGPLNGNIELQNKTTVVATIDYLYANTLVDVRTVFDKSLVSMGIKTADDNALDSIIEAETKLANEANDKRESARNLITILIILSIVWMVGDVILVIYIYKKYDKERVSSFKLEYHREFPAEYGPETMQYLMNSKIDANSLSASILNIIRKKGFEIKETENKKGKKEYTLIAKDIKFKEPLTEEELYIKDWLITDIGDGAEVSMDQIKNASKKLDGAQDFIRKYNSWSEKAKKIAIKEEFFDDNSRIKGKALLYLIPGFILMWLGVKNNISFIVTISIFILMFISGIYIGAFKKRTEKGNDHFVKWKAFKKFLLDFGRFNEKELPEIVLWEKYLVYAAALGIADKVSEAMEIRIKNMNLDSSSRGLPLYPYLYFNHAFTSSLVSTVNSAKSLSTSTIAQSQNSSGGGFGGGFSGGGGFGGGGSGGGGRGF